MCNIKSNTVCKKVYPKISDLRLILVSAWYGQNVCISLANSEGLFCSAPVTCVLIWSSGISRTFNLFYALLSIENTAKIYRLHMLGILVHIGPKGWWIWCWSKMWRDMWRDQAEWVWKSVTTCIRGVRVPLFSWFPLFSKFQCAKISAFSFQPIFCLLAQFHVVFPRFWSSFLFLLKCPHTPLHVTIFFFLKTFGKRIWNHNHLWTLGLGKSNQVPVLATSAWF